MDQTLLTYGSCTLRSSDISLLLPNNWLNDQIILFYYEYLQSTNPNPSCLLIDPSTSFILLIEEDEEDLREGLSQITFSNKRFIFFPINNHLDPGVNGGSHWTLLVVDLDQKKSFYYDSMNTRGQNFENAKLINRKLAWYLNIDEAKIVCVRIERPQNNSSDCGVFVLMITEIVYRNGDCLFRSTDVSPERAREMRVEIRKIVEELWNNVKSEKMVKS